jgi:hypothetical protein
MRAFDDRSPTSASTSSAGLFGGGDNSDHGPYSPPTEAEYVDAICGVIENTVEPDTWLVNGGTIGSFHCSKGRVIITHTPTVHSQVAELLAALQALSESAARSD